MSKFVAADAVEAMTVDFSKWNGPVGDIPEPTGEQVDTFMKNLRDLHKDYKALLQEGTSAKDSGDDEKMEEFLDKADLDAIRGKSEEQHQWIQEVTSGFIPADLWTRTGPRVFAAFLRWFTGELSPKAVSD
jgi:hypothetical protein